MPHSDAQMATIQVSNGALQHRASPLFTGEASLSREIYETLHKLLQHLIMIILLTSRLYVLPLLYVSHKLAKQDPLYPAS